MIAQTKKTTPLWRDERFWSVIVQLIVVAIVLSLYGVLLYTFNLNLTRTGLSFSFGFLGNPAGFSIGETLLKYETNDSYIWGLVVGAVNTFRLISVAFIGTTVLGIVIGVASFSQNLLLRTLSQIYVEIIRNTPLLLQLLFWYFVVFLSLPSSREPSSFANAIFLSKIGIVMPWPTLGQSLWLSLGLIVLAIIAAIVTWRWRIDAIVRQGQTGQLQFFILLGLFIVCIATILFGFQWEVPQQLESGLVSGGLSLSTEYSAVFAGLVVYTAAFIAEIVRGGIQSVSKGQWEAARSLGLSPGQVMQLVVFPQALRVIIPPLNSQYMNLAKNSSLALAIGYPDIYSVASTTLNQTGRPMEVFLILMTFYLSLNLIITLIMNTLNRMVQLQER
ncbi:MAG: amino acid ABC transporter permease [Prochlorotrichaceae cyanobacterium]|jgi:general L-amino acid transport system permease protein